jgi:8-oxo-dGTP pyrophosphatase MutT (NUDIX family)
MYVIYINDRPLLLRGTDETAPHRLATDDTHLQTRYTGKRKSLLNYADLLEKGSPKVRSVELYTDDLDGLWADFRSHYKWVEAAGGVVTNPKLGRQLFILRRGYWDLPKGKIDEGEERQAAALREVTEETGLQDIRLGAQLPTTYHTYRSKKEKRILKPTYWYRMSSEQESLVPEAEEGIERAEWRRLADVLAADAPLYANLRYLLEQV